MGKLENVLGATLAVVLLFGGLFLMYWVFKTLSYQIFYESMVLETIRETVSDAALK